MKTVSAIIFDENADAHNRFAKVVLTTALDIDWTIFLNGSDRNGDKVIPRFITIDNFGNANGLDFSIDGFGTSGIAPYTIAVLEINPFAQQLRIKATIGIVNVYISEKKLPISPGAKYTNTAVRKFLFINAGIASIIVPSDWNSGNNIVHCIGAGANGLTANGNSGGGGAYANKNNVALSAAAIVNCQIGAGNSGIDSWFVSAATVMAKAATVGGTTGGTAVASIGDLKYDGGNGQAVANSAGGGAAGPNGAGQNAPQVYGITNGGGRGDAGIGGLGGTNGVSPAFIGADGHEWTQTSNNVLGGSGGGGGGHGGANTVGGPGGNYGSGGGNGDGVGAGGAGTGGLIVLEWTP